jgi:hypothetical protein
MRFRRKWLVTEVRVFEGVDSIDALSPVQFQELTKQRDSTRTITTPLSVDALSHEGRRNARSEALGQS